MIIGFLFAKVKLDKKFELIICIAMLIIFLFGNLLNRDIMESGALKRVMMSQSIYGNIALFYITAAAGSILVILVSAKIENGILGKLLAYIGRNSIVYMCIHHYVMTWCSGTFTRFERMGYISNLTIEGILIFILQVMICSAIVPIIYYFFPNLMGKDGGWHRIKEGEA